MSSPPDDQLQAGLEYLQQTKREPFFETWGDGHANMYYGYLWSLRPKGKDADKPHYLPKPVFERLQMTWGFLELQDALNAAALAYISAKNAGEIE